MKQILIFSVAYHPFVGGAEVAVKQITNRITDIEFDLITLNLDGKQKRVEKLGNVTVYRVGGKGKIHKLLFPFTAWLMAKKLHQKKSYDATWSIMASFSGFAALFFKYSFPKVPYILTLQEGDPISYIKRQVWFIYPVFKQIFKQATIVQTISEYLKKFARDMGARSNIFVIPNGVDIELFTKKPASEDLEAAKKIINCQPRETILITTSRLVEKNGIAHVIEALALLPEKVRFVILGEGQLRKKLELTANSLHLTARVTFIGHVEYAKIPAYLACSDIFIRPSLSEGMGNSFVEAMAAGVPVIATSVGGIPDFLKDGETGLFCQPKNPQSIAEKIKLLMQSRELRAHLVAQAKKLAVSRYDWNLIAERMKTEIFAKVLI